MVAKQWHTHTHTQLYIILHFLKQKKSFQTILIDFLNQAIHVYHTESITIDRSPAINGAKVNSLFIHVLNYCFEYYCHTEEGVGELHGHEEGNDEVTFTTANTVVLQVRRHWLDTESSRGCHDKVKPSRFIQQLNYTPYIAKTTHDQTNLNRSAFSALFLQHNMYQK